MKSAVVYFSLEGNTKYAAEKIAEELEADIIPLVPLKKYPTGKFSKYFWCGKSSIFREKPDLENYDFDPVKYDMILLGTPIWGGLLTPPLRTFIRDNDLTGKKIAVFASCSGGSTDKCFNEFKNKISKSEIVSTLRLVEPYKSLKDEDEKTIHEFCISIRQQGPDDVVIDEAKM